MLSANALKVFTEPLMLTVEVVYASETQQACLSVSVAEGSSVADAIEQSAIMQQFPEIDLTQTTVGVFSKRVKLDHLVNDGDRIEIYRPLKIDPMQKRRQRARRED